MRANLSFGDQLELSLRAQLELSRDQLEASKAQLELARGDTVTEAACTDYTCAVKIIPAWVGILILTLGTWSWSWAMTKPQQVKMQ